MATVELELCSHTFLHKHSFFGLLVRLWLVRKFRQLARCNLLLDLISEVDKVPSYGARNLTWLKVRLVDALLTVLVIQAHYIPLKGLRIGREMSDLLHVLDFS